MPFDTPVEQPCGTTARQEFREGIYWSGMGHRTLTCYSFQQYLQEPANECSNSEKVQGSTSLCMQQEGNIKYM